MGRNVSALIQSKNVDAIPPSTLPQKCKAPNTFTIPCTIVDFTFTNAMLDLGASINVMPTSIHRSLHLGDLKPIGVVIHLANRSVAIPLGVIEDMLVRVKDLIFPTNFYNLDMENESSSHGSTLILGRLFLMITKTKIDVHARTLSMEFGDDVMHFNIFEAMRHPAEEHFVFLIDIIDDVVDSVNIYTYLFFYFSDEFAALCSICAKISSTIHSDCDAGAGSNPPISLPPTANLPFPSTIQPPSLELKPLPKHLKYAYLDGAQKLPVIISTNLTLEHEDKLLHVLRGHRKAIGWTLANLLRINPSI
ncbi:uncharacterized protein LOC114384040 [Glycine soja]|uniref:uncharacterized protein LOC114384040 n=1 Tax=Glycine soja TaxID=3848 RepID=UPI00103A2A75|nr:uncharacterized protein LOC114384040 [Glycine soja]